MSKRNSRLDGGREGRKKRPLRIGGYLIVTDGSETEINYLTDIWIKILKLKRL